MDNIVSLVENSLNASKLLEFQTVVDQLKEKISAEFANQLGVHLASFRGMATTFFNLMIDQLRGANLVCKDRGADCLSDLGAFLNGELIREEKDQVDSQEAEEDAAEGAVSYTHLTLPTILLV